MDHKEKQELANLISEQVCLTINGRITDIRKDVDAHNRILKGKNGDPSLPELVRANAKQIKQLYAGIGIVLGAFIVEFIAWLVPKLMALP